MEDKSLYNSQQRQEISANLQNYIDSMYTTQHGGKPWTYFLVSHLDIEPTFSFKYVCELSKKN